VFRVGCGISELRDWLRPAQASRVFIRWLGWAVHRWLWGYGMDPLLPLRWMGVVVAVFGFVVYPLTGIVQRRSMTHGLIDGRSQPDLCDAGVWEPDTPRFVG
jgi:hypothetical protein